MTDIAALYKQAELALAAYADLAPGTPNSDALQRAGMTEPQAIKFERDWKVVDQKNSPSGLSATIFKEVSTGKCVLAIRGTDDVRDLLTDIVDIAIIGSTVRQHQYWELKTQVGQWLDERKLPLHFDVTGHSLGGFLASGIAADFAPNVDAAHLYNAPGLNGTFGASAALNVVLRAIGAIGVADPTKIFNVKAEAGISPIASLGSTVSPPIWIKIENQISEVSDLLTSGNHSQVVLTDTLAIYDAFATLVPSISLETISAVMKSASAENRFTVERTLDALRVFLVGETNVAAAPTPELRETLYTNLYDLQDSTSYRAATNNSDIRLLLPQDMSLWKTSAKTDFSEFLALRNLLPFVLNAPENILGLADTEIYGRWRDDQQARSTSNTATVEFTDSWYADRADMLARTIVYNTADGNVALRSNRVFSTLYENKHDATVTDVSILVAGTQSQSATTTPVKIIFGSDQGETINGGDVFSGDHLYGGGGRDTLYGNGGKDYLEGGSGDDLLIGGDGDDILVGMQDNDILIGGKGQDKLDGGTGFDTYKYTSGDGFDTITDLGGAGEIRYTLRGTEYVLSGGKKVGDLWESDDHRFTYKYFESLNRLVINGGQIVVFNFRPGHLGITLDNAAPVLVPDTELQLYGSSQDNFVRRGEASANFPPGTVQISGQGITYVPTLRGALIQGFGGADILDGSPGDDRIYGDRITTAIDLDQQVASGARGAFINGFEGKDLIYGSAALDVLYGGGGEDTLFGGPGNDVLWGDSLAYAAQPNWYVQTPENAFSFFIGNTVSIDAWNDIPGFGVDQIYGGAGDDIILAGGSNDILSGDAGNDALGGDDGDDVILGGAGDDLVQGDVPYPHIAGTNIGNDYIDGGDGADRLHGLRGNDAIFGGAGNDFLYGDQAFGDPATPLLAEHGDDYLDGGDGNDEVWGDGGDDMLLGGAGTDLLRGGRGNDWLDGGDGNDQLSADDGNDTLAGGPGIDGLNGGAGDDTYIIAAADLAIGREYIQDTQGTSYLQLGVAPDSFSVSSIGADVLLNFGDGRELLIVSGLVGGMSSIQFASGETYDFLSYLRERLTTRVYVVTSAPNSDISGGPNGDVLTAYGANASFFGGKGTDQLFAYSPQGGATIHLDLGDGEDLLEGKIDPATRDSRAWNVIEFGEGITAESLHLSAGGLHTIALQYGTQGDEIDFYIKANSGLLPIDAVRFDDGSVLTWEELVRPGVEVDYSNEGQIFGTQARGGTEVDDRITGSPYRENLWGYNGNDVIDSRGGDDSLIGGSGNDSYIFGYGDGRDVIQPTDRSVGDVEVLRFRGNVAPSDVSFVRHDNDLIARLDNTSDRITVGYFFVSNPVSVEFADGTTYSSAAVPVAAGPSLATPYSDELFGAPWAEIFDARAGNDVVTAGSGDDFVDGGSGNDTLNGEAGNDTLIGGPGRDLLVGGAGNDTYVLRPEDGYGEISDSQGTNSILITGAPPADIHLTRTTVRTLEDSLVVQIGTSADQLWIPGYFVGTNTISTIEFAGTTWDQNAIASSIVDIRGAANALVGTTGNNIFTVDSYGDTITDSSDVDVDTVQTSLSYILPANIENLTLTGTLDLEGYGNNQRNLLQGNSANNRLYVSGSSWDGYLDTLKGGAGDDEYHFTPGLTGWSPLARQFPATIVENPNEGVDTLITTWYYASLPANVENLTVTGVEPFDGLQFSGYSLTEDLRPRFIGNSDSNILDLSALTNANQISLINKLGGAVIDGGAGADVLIGSDENDFYVIDNPGDLVVERSPVSTSDTVVTPFSATLPVNVENIELTGSNPVTATGDVADNRLSGSKNVTSNVLAGGPGDDTYIVDATDIVAETSGEGDDTVVMDVPASANGFFLLANYANVENIRAAKDAGGVGLIGNDSDNAIYGSRAGNVLRGEGGNDTIGDVYRPEYLVHPLGRSYGVPNDSDQLFGGAGDDTLQSYSGNDLLDGGFGNDILIAGTDVTATFVFGAGYGSDEIRNSGVKTTDDTLGSDRINWTSGTDMSALRSFRDGQDLLVWLSNSADQLRIDNFFDASGNIVSSVDRWDLPGGIVLSRAAIAASLSAFDRGAGTANADLLIAGVTGSQLRGDAGDDWLLGQLGGDLLDGANGNDTLIASAGADTLVGGIGDDVLSGGLGADRFVFSSGFGSDLIVRDSDYQSGLVPDMAVDTAVFDSTIAPESVELSLESDAIGYVLVARITGTSDALRITDFRNNPADLTGTVEEFRFANGTVWSHIDLVATGLPAVVGTEGADKMQAGSAATRLQGLGGDDQLIGGAGNDILEGGAGRDTLNGGAGADMMVGGLDDDTYVVDSVGDFVAERPSEGLDLIQSSITATLPDNVENLTLMSTGSISGTGTAFDNVLIGNGAGNSLWGGAGNDTINGGAGIDTMYGETGDDILVVDNASDTAIGGPGTDTVQSSINYTLSDWNEVEQLTLIGTNAISGTGNVFDNVLTGNSGNNVLYGKAGNDTLVGGSGSDKLYGGFGDDIYVYDGADSIFENSNEGIDAVVSAFTYTLAANVENLTLTNSSPISGKGNALANVLTGNSAANGLDGGTGADRMVGGAGDDTYTVDNADDVAIENANEGVDTVQSSVSHVLGSNIEKLTLTGSKAIIFPAQWDPKLGIHVT